MLLRHVCQRWRQEIVLQQTQPAGPRILPHMALLLQAPPPTGLTVMSKGLLSTSGALSAASIGSAASAPLKGVVVYRLLYTALGLAARASSSEGVLPSPEVSCRQQCETHAVCNDKKACMRPCLHCELNSDAGP